MNRKTGLFIYLLVILVFVLLSIDFYLSKEHYQPSGGEFLANPKKYSGQIVQFSGRVLNISEDSFYLSLNQMPLKVYYAGLEKPKLGQVEVKVELNEDGTAKALDMHVLSYNYIKYFISFFGLILFVFIFFKEWRLKKWRFVENA